MPLIEGGGERTSTTTRGYVTWSASVPEVKYVSCGTMKAGGGTRRDATRRDQQRGAAASGWRPRAAGLRTGLAFRPKQAARVRHW